MNDKTYRQQIVEVDLKELLWRLLLQWKAVLLVSVIMAMVVSSVKYSKDIKLYNAEQKTIAENAEQAKTAPEIRIAKIMESLLDSDADAVQMVLREQEWLDEQREYLDNSILMKINPADRRVLKLTYDVEGELSNDIPVLLEDYALFINGDRYRDAIGSIINPSADRKYIGELIWLSRVVGPEVDSGQTGAVLIIHITLPEESDAEKVVNASNAILTDYSKEIGSLYSHTISIAGTDISHEYNYDYVNRQYDLLSRVSGMESTIKSVTENVLTEEQKSAYNAITSIKNGYDDIASASTVAENDLYYSDKPDFSKKYVIYGFLIGAFLYMCIYAMIYILSGKVNSAVSAQNFIHTRLLGETYYDSEPKGFNKLLHSKFLEKKCSRYRTSEILQIEKASKSIDAVCGHAGVNKISVIDVGYKDIEEKSKSVLELLTDTINKRGISVSTVCVDDSFEENDLLDVKNAVVAVYGDTKAATLGQTISICRDFDVDILGCIYIARK